jgi:hypothetical protein
MYKDTKQHAYEVLGAKLTGSCALQYPSVHMEQFRADSES